MNIKDRFNRIVLVEPNLISYGHVVEVPLNIQKFLLAKGVSFEIVGNKLMEEQIQKLFPKKYMSISNPCFGRPFDNGYQFYSDLKEIKRKLKLNNKDLVIILTSYINEAIGVKKFIQGNFASSPLFILLFHQLFPPEGNFLTTIKKKYRREAADRFKNLSNMNGKVYFFSTPSEKLRSTYQRWTGLKFGILPIPFNLGAPRSSSLVKGTTIGFLGDGRYEKGLLLFLDLISKGKEGNNYVIQNVNPRGYPQKDWNKFRRLMVQLKLRNDIKFYNNPLLPKDFSSLIDKIDIVLLPYHPKSYDARVSGILIQSVIKKKIVIATKGTWLGKEISVLNVGETFNYESDYKSTIISLGKSLDRALKRKSDYNLESASETYRKYYNAESFFRVLEEQI